MKIQWPFLLTWLTGLVLVISAYLPWAAIPEKHLHFTGMDTTGSNFGEPGLLNIFLTLLILLTLSINRVWAVRSAIFVAAFLTAWSLRNYILFARCEMGICPVKGIGLYLSLFSAIALFLLSLLGGKGAQKPPGTRV